MPNGRRADHHSTVPSGSVQSTASLSRARLLSAHKSDVHMAGGRKTSLKGLWRFARESFGGIGSSNARKGSAAGSAQILIRQVSSDSERGSYRRTPSPPPTSSTETLATDDIWYDCNEDFEQAAQEDSAALDSATVAGSALNSKQCLQQAYASLPEQLATIVQRYVQGTSVGCKPTVALIKYMESTATTLQQLRQQLAPLMAEQTREHSTCGSKGTTGTPMSTGVAPPYARAQPIWSPKSMRLPNQPTPPAPTSATTAVWPADTSNQVPCQQQQQQRIQQQQMQPAQQQSMHDLKPSHCISRLLSNVELVQETLSGMDQWDGFKQVAWGQLEMWYCHDSANQRQLMKARIVLNQPLLHAVCLAREVELVPSWNPAFLDCRELKAYSPSELLIYILSWCPWPLPCGELLNYALGVDLLDTQDRCVLLATNTPSENQLQGIEVPHHPRTLRVTMHTGGFKFVPLPPDPSRPHVQRMEALVLISIDAKRLVVPDSIISFLLKIFAPLVYKSVMKVLGSIFSKKDSKVGAGDAPEKHSVLLDRLNARPEYGALHRRCCKYVESLLQQQKN